jgi:hypothetical protein
MIIRAHIPTQLKFYCRGPIHVQISNRKIKNENDETEVFVGDQIYVTDAENERTQKSALRWASHNFYQWDAEKNAEVLRRDYVPTIVDFSNNPMRDIRILDLEHRGEGGRAYQVLVHNKYIFDLREDVLFDTILNEGVRKNAILNGEFIFAMIQSEMKLIRVGSYIHQLALETMEAKKNATKQKFEVGKIYSSANQTFLYLGKVKNGNETVYCKLFISPHNVDLLGPNCNLEQFNVYPFQLELTKSDTKAVCKEIGFIEGTHQQILDMVKARIKDYVDSSYQPHEIYALEYIQNLSL